MSIVFDFTLSILTNPIFPFATLLLGYLIGHRLAIGRDRRKEFNSACDDFRDAFLPEMIFLKHNAKISDTGSSNNLGEFLSYGYIHRHLKAFEIFRNYLSSKERKDIDEAWEQYYHDKDNSITLYYEQFGIEGKKPTDKIESEKELVLKRIEKILKFAQHK